MEESSSKLMESIRKDIVSLQSVLLSSLTEEVRILFINNSIGRKWQWFHQRMGISEEVAIGLDIDCIWLL